MIKDTTQPTLPFNYTAIVFDMDGVIFDSEVAVMNFWLELSDKYGIKDIMKDTVSRIWMFISI